MLQEFYCDIMKIFSVKAKTVSECDSVICQHSAPYVEDTARPLSSKNVWSISR